MATQDKDTCGRALAAARGSTTPVARHEGAAHSRQAARVLGMAARYDCPHCSQTVQFPNLPMLLSLEGEALAVYRRAAESATVGVRWAVARMCVMPCSIT
eukprot:6191880-Pleurochrysis_carterae.AAC.1